MGNKACLRPLSLPTTHEDRNIFANLSEGIFGRNEMASPWWAWVLRGDHDPAPTEARESETTVPAMDFNVESNGYKSMGSTRAWAGQDLAGQDLAARASPLPEHPRWDLCSAVREPGTRTHEELRRLLAEDQLLDTVLLVSANEQDLPDATKITDKLGLHSLSHRNSYMQATCATSGDRLYEGMDWLFSQLQNHK